MQLFHSFEPSSSQLLFKSKVHSNTFAESMKFPVRLAQIFSYFPIYIGKHDEPIKFKWLYWRMGYSCIAFLLFVTEFIFVVVETCKHKLTIIDIRVIVFQLGAVIQYILFFKLTYVWPRFIKEWRKVELHMKNYEIIENLKLKIACLASSIMFIAGVEHGLVNAYKLKDCFDKEPTAREAFQTFFTYAYEHIFHVIGYSFWLGSLIQFLNLQRTFYWSYTDVFIMLMGSVLTYRLKQLSQKIKETTKVRVNDMVVWKTLRKDYIRISELCFVVNEKLSGIIICCFLMDLYFVLIQLYGSLRNMESVIEKVYFFLSFGLVLLRIFCMCIFGGAVYEEWKNIKFHLSTVDATAYNAEVERLMTHVTTCELSLSGKNFFSIYRGLMLQMAGAIVTYELVLIQFYKRR
ncbi:gustatory receptor 5a for trehalose [Diabrotica virgifera virgifera]|uniref:Gustatory receptor n=2 Tax=Diabrotica virgifera virgifera TaxID=50390 RepID=A0ABM5L7D0_DIAVI|nr:gustatory receptor 5a for trehalose [Diabrotica virgifera virgifera]